MSGGVEHPVEPLHEHERLHESEIPSEEVIGNVGPTGYLDPPPGVPVPTGFEGQPNPVLPLNGHLSGQERRNDLQGNIGTAADEGAKLAQNSLHIDLLARKVAPEMADKLNVGFDKSWLPFFTGEGSNPDAYSITRENFQAYILSHPDPVASRYAVVDLRNPASPSDLAGNGVNTQIRGAVHEHVDEGTFAGSSLSVPYDFRKLKLPVPGNFKATIEANWAQAVLREPWKSIRNKDIVFFHCRESINRTPYIASGYLEYGRPYNSKQKVIIIEGGFNNEINWPQGTTEPWNVNV
ncbi:unnamed protein product [Mycena citricolor]|uniref:Rhodanese domain-containing protein n=1 Tax=Mycena citricolor TaxID=2018698 RepID=A0AAD2K334_9AGAR|nr:unnamed protein product [Mycena citricolor]CAK5276310.1 unnamed protein product [Mycena citricolor]